MIKLLLRYNSILFFIFISSIITHPLSVFAQADHYESIVLDNDSWNYFIGISEPPSDWKNASFDPSPWSVGQGGFGYGDLDDNTVVPDGTISVYFRKSFSINSLADIEDLFLNMDYDDSFVAYLNGEEIARAGIGTAGIPPTFDQTASSLHEAVLYQGFAPVQFAIPVNKLVDGDNILAVQIHNGNNGSSDLSGRAFLIAGIKSTAYNYRSTPNWFAPPVSYGSSNLPIIVLNTNGQPIPDEPRIVAQMGIINNGNGLRNKFDDPFNHFDGRIEIEIRGSSSQGFPKKNYRIEIQDETGMNLDTALLGMPSENDWVLHGPFSDKSLIRNDLTYYMGRKMGRYAPRTRFVELMINQDYQGVYVLMESIKRDSNRVDISNLKPTDIAGDQLTGGYIFKVDRADPQGGGWYSDYETDGQNAYYQLVYPKPTEVMPQQFEYIKNTVKNFESTVISGNVNDPLSGFATIADEMSFVDFLLMNEVSNNVDGYRLSTYFYKEKITKGGKIVSGPLWDFNLAFGNADYCEGWSTTVWAYKFNDRCGSGVPFYWKKLMSSERFISMVKDRWATLREGPFHLDSLYQYIDGRADYLSEAQVRNFERWNILGNYVWPNAYVGNTYQDEIDYLKNWLFQRVVFLDREIAALEVPIYYSELVNYKTQVFPNPFHDELTVKYALIRTMKVNITLFNSMGQRVFYKDLGLMDRGYHEVNFESQLLNSDEFRPGVYSMRIMTKDGVLSTSQIVKW